MNGRESERKCSISLQNFVNFQNAVSESLNLEFGKNNNPRHLHEGHFIAFLGNYPKFSTYVAFYENAVETLFKQVSQGNETADMVGLPLLFLMRHTLELGYKYSLSTCAP
jgi:hypothetical protein